MISVLIISYQYTLFINSVSLKKNYSHISINIFLSILYFNSVYLTRLKYLTILKVMTLTRFRVQDHSMNYTAINNPNDRVACDRMLMAKKKKKLHNCVCRYFLQSTHISKINFTQ